MMGDINIIANAGEVISRGQVLARYTQQQALSANYKSVNLSVPVDTIDRNHQSWDKILKWHNIISSKQSDIKTQLLMHHLQKSGYNAPPLTLNEFAKAGHENEIHVIDNRAGCATKLYADLKQAGYNVRIFCAPGDETTPVVTNALPGEVIPISHYNDQKAVLEALAQLAQAHKDKKIYLHPGWGFLSENDEFVAKLETLSKQYNVVFVGPASEPMRIAAEKNFP